MDKIITCVGTLEEDLEDLAYLEIQFDKVSEGVFYFSGPKKDGSLVEVRAESFDAYHTTFDNWTSVESACAISAYYKSSLFVDGVLMGKFEVR